MTAIQLIDPGSEFVANDTRVIVNQIDPGATSDPVIEPEGTVNWEIVDATNPSSVLFTLSDFSVNSNTSDLMVVTQERVYTGPAGGELHPLTIPVVVKAAPAFGGPEAIGQELFTNYMLVFQLLAVLLLAAMVGAIVLTHRQVASATRRVTGRRRVSRPLVNVISSQVGHDVTTSGEPVPELQEPVGE